MNDLIPIFSGTRNLFAADIESILGVLIGFGLVVVIPVVAIFTHHQRKMAELYRGQASHPTELRTHQQLEMMQMQINELKGLIQDHIIRNDSPAPSITHTPPPTPTSIEQRLNG